MRRGLAAAIAAGNHVFAIISYVVLVQDLWDLGEFDEVEQVVEEGLDYTREREMDFYVKHLTAHQAKLQALRGDWATAEATLRELVGARAELEPGSLRYALPDLALLAGKRGSDDAAELLDWCQDFAERAGGYYDVVPAALVAIESAWLSGRPELARAPIQRILRYAGRGLQTRHRGEVQRWLHRLGQPHETFPDCPEVFAAGLRGDWKAAAGAWQRVRAPYQQAMELLDSGDVEATLVALRIFDSLGAGPALQIARRRLRDLGVSQVPRGPQPTTRANPAGLTDRQVEILTMLSSGCTNAEIAARLVVSVRTVDHHVSAVLQKLGLTSRRQAGQAAAALGLASSRENRNRLASAAGGLNPIFSHVFRPFLSHFTLLYDKLSSQPNSPSDSKPKAIPKSPPTLPSLYNAPPSLYDAIPRVSTRRDLPASSLYYLRKVDGAVDAAEDVAEDVEGHNKHRRVITGWE